MKKLLICLLLLANFGTGLAFALDSHPEAAAGHDSTMIDLLVAVDQDSPEGDLHYDDHSCHGAAHLSGIIHKQAMQPLINNPRDFLALSETPKILYIAPLLRPPIS